MALASRWRWSAQTLRRRLASSAATPHSENAAKHVVVGMSGGVDSSVAALLLRRQGFRVTGVYMKNWDTSDELGAAACPHDAEFRDVQAVCAQLGIEAQQVNLVQSYWNAVFSPCLESFEEVRASKCAGGMWFGREAMLSLSV